MLEGNDQELSVNQVSSEINKNCQMGAPDQMEPGNKHLQAGGIQISGCLE